MSLRPLRVTQVVFDLDGGGMETLVANMAAHWRGAGITVSVITLSGRVGRVGAVVRPLVDRFIVLRPRPGLSMLAPLELARAIRDTSPDVVHLHTGAWYKGALAARIARAPRVVYTEHGREHDDPLMARLQDRVASRWTDAVVAVSGRLRGYLIDCVGVAARRVVAIANGVDTAMFAPGPPASTLRRALHIADDALVLGSVGRFEPVKAYPRLVKAFAEVRRRLPDRHCVLVIFGDGRDRPAIEQEVERSGVRDDVRLPGWTDGAADAYRLLDAFVLTSRSEGMSLSLLEAMACGVCPIVTDVGANAEVLGPSLASQIVPSVDADSFVDAVVSALGSAGVRTAVGIEARARVMATYALPTVFARYESLYRGEGGESAVFAPSLPRAAQMTATLQHD